MKINLDAVIYELDGKTPGKFKDSKDALLFALKADVDGLDDVLIARLYQG